MRVCFVIEGAYPYVYGGVSSWAHSYISDMKDVDFVLWIIGAEEKDKDNFKYKLPENVVEVHQVFLDNAMKEMNRPLVKKTKFTDAEVHEIKELLSCNRPDWEIIFSLFQEKKCEINYFFSCEIFMQAIEEICEVHKDYPFTDTFYNTRSMFLPLLYLLCGEIPSADIYHAVSTGYAGSLASMAGFMKKKPFLLTEHGIYTREREEEIIRSNWIQDIFRNEWIRFFYMLSNMAYTQAALVSSLFQNARQMQISMGCDSKKCIVIKNGIYYDRYKKIATKKKNGMIDIGAIIRIAPIKDVKSMLHTFYEVHKMVPNTRLHIMGPVEDEKYAAECYALAKQLSLESVIFTGRVDVISYMEILDFTILSSISEGQPLAVLESFAAGRPVVATDVGSCRELIEGSGKDSFGPAGFCVAPMYLEGFAEAMIHLCKSPELRRKMGEAGRKRVQQYYGHDLMMKQYRNMYKEVM